MTMSEIDRLRDELGRARALVERFRIANADNKYHPGGRCNWYLADAEAAENLAELAVLAALRKWWKQDCREISNERPSS